jgi:cellulose synthase/poly-beta-1,6-N-acetylglucosamine synthase-like glycosyltransferase
MLAILYAIAMLVLLVYGLNLFWLVWQRVQAERMRPGIAPDPLGGTVPDDSWPYVTVQLPLYNEPAMAARLIDAAAALDYPSRRLEIQVLDDSTDETVGIVSERVEYWQRRGVDIMHIHRLNRDGYKAGALQNGLRLGRGEFIAVFDADFIPPQDFLLRILPEFKSLGTGMVQARWGHLNASESLLTRLQAFGLDAHFAVEQYARQQAGCFINFNGTAGIWRRACIEAAGGWQADTLTEDLDLSYRAQINGWKLHYFNDLEVLAELPSDAAAFRTQQFRWTKGAAETAIKMLGTLWRSGYPLRIKLEGTLHLTAHAVFPFLLAAMLLHAPLMLLVVRGEGPGEAYFAILGLGLFGLMGFFLAQLFAQRTLYPDWTRRMLLFPLFMAGSMSMAVNNTHALAQALIRKRTPFIRTPKYGPLRRDPEVRRLPRIVWIEAALGAYGIAGLWLLVRHEVWAALPFQFMFCVGFAWLTVLNFMRAEQQRQALSASIS